MGYKRCMPLPEVMKGARHTSQSLSTFWGACDIHYMCIRGAGEELIILKYDFDSKVTLCLLLLFATICHIGSS